MSERIPQEEMDQQFTDLPLPDEETSWQKMKELLDKDDDDRILPPVFLKSCLGWGVFLLVGLGVVWFVVHTEKRWNEPAGGKPGSVSEKNKEPLKVDKSLGKQKANSVGENANGNRNNKTSVILTPGNKTNEATIVRIPNLNKQTAATEINAVKDGANKVSKSVTHVGTQKSKTQKQQTLLKIHKEMLVPEDTIRAANKKLTPAVENHQQNDKAADVAKQPVGEDTTRREMPFQSKDSLNQKKGSKTHKKLFIAAGIGGQQQIPVAGQTAVPYSSYGRRGSLSDYVPSLYIQLQKEKKWFAQAEFRYGAAQSVKEFSYNRQTRYDTGTRSVSVTTMRLKKTYYHQLPLSFNYYVKPNFSVGVGGIYSRFYRAITEREIQTLNILTQTATNSKVIIPVRNFADSFLYKTQVHILLQADYQWKKFLFGLRYTKDVQPYIKYTKPDGTVNEEKNQSLQLFVRYRIWKSKNF